MLLVAALTVLLIYAGLIIALFKDLSSATKRLITAFGGGVVIYFIGTSLARLASTGQNLVTNTVSGNIYVGNAAIFFISMIIGLIVGPLILVFVDKETRYSIFLASGVGLLNLSLGLTFNQDYTGGLITLSVLTITLIGLKFLFEGLTLSASLLITGSGIRDTAIVGFIAGAPAVVGMYLGTSRVTDLINPFTLSLAVGLLLFSMPQLVSAPKDNGENALQFTGLLFGIALMAVVEAAITLLGY